MNKAVPTIASDPSSNDQGGAASGLLAALGVPYEANADLGKLTWFGIGGAAETLARPTSIEQTAKLFAACAERRVPVGVPVRVLGSGANLLVREGVVPGVIIKLDAPAFSQLDVDGTRVTVGAGYDMMRLTQELARRGLRGLECMAGIPASIGGAVRMNAGGAFGEIGPAVAGVTVISQRGEIQTLTRDQLAFSYRHASIEQPLIAEVTLDLEQGDIAEARAEVKRIFDYKKHSQPMAASSAGCCFKNPSKEQPAGKLIDECGLKGARIGGAEVSAVHANFVVVHEDGNADDVAALIEHVTSVVREKTSVTLQREVVIWPDDA